MLNDKLGKLRGHPEYATVSEELKKAFYAEKASFEEDAERKTEKIRRETD